MLNPLPIDPQKPTSNRVIRQSLPTLLAALAVALTSGITAGAQEIQTSISNEFRYGIGERFEQDVAVRKEYLENLFNTRVYVGDFTLGFRLQVDKPREYGRDTIGLKEYYAEFKRDGLRVRGGTFYNLIDRGLTFNSFESRPIGFDTQTEGVRIDYESTLFGSGLFGGVMNYTDLINTARIYTYRIRGASGEIRPIPELGIGGAYVAASGVPSRTGFTIPFDAYLRQIYLRGDVEGLSSYLSLADKRTQLDSATRTDNSSGEYGYGMYAMLGYNTDLFGITAEYKNYRFDLVAPDEQTTTARETATLPFQNPPTLIPEYDKTLLARNPHAIDNNDEVGFQVETLVYPAEDLTMTLLTAAGSRHNAFTAVVDSSSGERVTAFSRAPAPVAFPKINDVGYSPYWEIYFQSEYQASEDLALTFGLQRKDNTIYYEGDGMEIHPHTEQYKATTILLESLIGFSSSDNLHAILELQRVFDSKKVTSGNDSLGVASSDGRFNNALLTLEYSSSPRWTLSTRLEYTTTDSEERTDADPLVLDPFGKPVKEGRHIWPVIAGTYRIGSSHTLGLQYGSERGGVVCTGGVCRLINPFTGFRLSLVSKL